MNAQNEMSTGAKGLEVGSSNGSQPNSGPDFGAFPKIGSGIWDLGSGGKLNRGVVIFLFFFFFFS